MKQVQKGKGEAFKKLVQHYHELVFQVSYFILGEKKKAEDLAKDTFLYVHSHLDDFFNTNQRFSLWLVHITVRLGEKQMMEVDVVSHRSEINHKGDYLKTCSHQELHSSLMEICLQKRLALIFHSNYLFSEQEIGEVLQIPKTEITSYVWQGREKLRERLFSAL